MSGRILDFKSYNVQRVTIGASLTGSIGLTANQAGVAFQYGAGGSLEILVGATVNQLGTGFRIIPGVYYNMGAYGGTLCFGAYSGATSTLDVFTFFNG